MKKIFLILILIIFIIGCTNITYENKTNEQQTKKETIIGNDSDIHGCKASAGYSWCEKKQKCIRTWEESCNIESENIDVSKLKITKNEFAPNYIISTTKDGITYEFPLRYKLEQLNSVLIEKNIIKLIKDKIYITKDQGLGQKTNGDSTIASIEAGDVLAKAYNKEVQSALTEKIDKTIPKKTCNDISDNTTIIYIKLGNENIVYIDNSCIIIEGKDGKGLIMSGEKLAYYLISKL
jgi:hypothetical protein